MTATDQVRTGVTAPTDDGPPPAPTATIARLQALFGAFDEPATEVALTDRQRTVRDAIRAVARDELLPRAARLDVDGAFPEAGYQALAATGLGGLVIDPDLGGTGDGTVAYAVAMEEITAACGATSLVYMTQMHGAFPIVAFGSDAQRRTHVPRLCDGTAYGAIAITEPGGGSDVASLTTTARKVEGGYVLDGAKTFITTGDRADVLVVFATTDRSAGRAGVTAFLVEAPRAGYEVSRTLHKLGMRGSSTNELAFADCFVPDDARLGDEGQGFAIAMASVVKTRISAAAQGIGLARAAWTAGVAWADERGLLDPRVRHGHAVQLALGALRADIAAARALLHATAALIDAGGTGRMTAEVGAAKARCTDLGVAVATAVTALMGADGDRTDLVAERILRDAKVTQIYDGTNQIQQVLISRDTAQRAARALDPQEAP